MYPLSRNAIENLSFLVGKEICQVSIGSYDVQFNWGNGGISVWCKFTYKPAGSVEEVVWSGKDPDIAARTVRLLKASITAVECTEQGTLRLGFSNGDQLEVFENERYESFSIQNGKDSTIIV
jgi:hypothetical protein